MEKERLTTGVRYKDTDVRNVILGLLLMMDFTK